MDIQITWGIGDIALYVPDPHMELSKLLLERTVTNPEMERILRKAAKKTGQVSFRFPEPWEDTASLAANASALILNNLSPEETAGIRYLVTGTETELDHSKPAASYVQGMLQKAGFPLSNSLTTFEVKHACAGGTIALMAVASMLAASGRQGERGMAVNTDIARYDAPSTAEITQGAGAAAVLVESNPRLIQLDLEHQGFFASDVDDFFRPLGAVTARVKGQYSMQCYQESLEKAFLDYCRRVNKEPGQAIDEIDYAAFHVPFARMPETALLKLLTHICKKNPREGEEFLQKSGFREALYLNSSFGNLYTGALFTYTAALLYQEYQRHGQGIVGKSILFGSYGSGNTMLVFKGVIAPGAPGVIASWNIPQLMASRRQASFEDYLNWLARPTAREAWDDLLEGARPRPGHFYLKGFNKAGLRIYDRK